MPPRTNAKRPISSYRHDSAERVNNPPAGLVNAANDPDAAPKRYAYDPHLDPQLVWAGKAERLSFDVPTVSLHEHERLDPRTIIEAVRRRNGDGQATQPSLFESDAENPPLREAIEFYAHPRNWSNRLVAGDSLLVMNSLIEKEALAGKVQMIYFDPPYGIKYGSNFQPFVNKRDVKDGDDADLTAEPEQIAAFRDTWELGIHSYLAYLRDRLLVARDLLTESGSIFVQIGDENVHLVRLLMDEVFGVDNSMGIITFRTHSPLGVKHLPHSYDYIVWYSKSRSAVKYRQLYVPKEYGEDTPFNFLEDAHGERHRSRETLKAVPEGSRIFRLSTLSSSGYTPSCIFPFDFEGKTYNLAQGKSWRTTEDGMKQLAISRRLYPTGNYLNFVQYHDDFSVMPINNNWGDTYTEMGKTYVVQTSEKIIARCMLMTTDPGDLVFDPTCGSGTTAVVAEQWGRRWITCDTSRVAVTLAKQRLMTALYDYYELAHPDEGVGSGFVYKTVPHITLGSIANNPDIREGMTRAEIDAAIARHAPQETLRDQPRIDASRKRVSGPFTVEAVPALFAHSVDDLVESAGVEEMDEEDAPPQWGAAWSGEASRQEEWRGELAKTGIRGKGGQLIRFARLEALPALRYLHADGHALPEEGDGGGRRVVVSFGPNHAPLERRQVEQAVQEARTLVPPPEIVVFAAFQFDAEAAKDIDETRWPNAALLKAQMNADLLTGDLKKKRASNESFWLVGQPDVEVETIAEGADAGKFRALVRGFDYYDARSGNLYPGGEEKIAMWLLDPDYDGRALYPRQAFFPMAGPNDGWARLARNLRAEIDESLIEAYRGTASLPFEAGPNRRVAVKIVDDRGIESLRALELG